jgi:hypothetical protein
MFPFSLFALSIVSFLVMGLPKDSALMLLAAMDPSMRFLMADLRDGVLILKNNETIQNQEFQQPKY